MIATRPPGWTVSSIAAYARFHAGMTDRPRVQIAASTWSPSASAAAWRSVWGARVAACGLGEHVLAVVEADHPPGFADSGPQCGQIQSGAAGDVEHGLTLSQAQ